MNNYYGKTWSEDDQPSKILGINVVNAFIQRVFIVMAAGLAITGLTAYSMFNLIVSDPARYLPILTGPMGYVIMFAPIGLVLLMSFMINQMSYLAITLCYGLFTFILGIGLSSVFIVYNLGSIMNVFFITAGMFGTMAFIGATTKRDLSGLGTYLYMGLIGMMIAGLVNFFLGSSLFGYIYSVIGVVIFTAFIAYDMQNIMRASLSMNANEEEAKKASVMGALSLYLDFINLFLFLLRLLGGKNND